ncbi:hypothetical protein, partial [Paenarthrobacter sp. CAP02]|uniref:hypothetical protein n=1 Tax=Paenarthrobacter sp. CAP02 TaxID=3158144 RepID=UPI0032DA72DF
MHKNYRAQTLTEPGSPGRGFQSLKLLVSVFLSVALLLSLGARASFAGTADVAPPVLDSVSMVSPAVVGPGDVVKFAWTASDASAISHVEFWAYGPSGKIKRVIAGGTDSRIGGVSRGHSSMSVDALTWPAGDWRVEFVAYADVVGNATDTRYVASPPDLSKLTFKVAGTSADVAPPVLDSVSMVSPAV